MGGIHHRAVKHLIDIIFFTNLSKVGFTVITRERTWMPPDGGFAFPAVAVEAEVGFGVGTSLRGIPSFTPSR